MARVETIVYRGIVFRRYPDSPRRSDRVYFTPGGADRAAGVKRLHQEIWEDLHGPTPPGHHIHHLDENPLNNDPSNLACWPVARHRREHGPVTPGDDAAMDRIRPLANRWHRSAEGRQWHREHAQQTIPPPIEQQLHVCVQCGQTYEAFPSRMHSPNRYCSKACNAAHRRATGVDDETRVCSVCGAEFTVNRYAKQRACSRICGWRLISLARRQHTGG